MQAGSFLPCRSAYTSRLRQKGTLIFPAKLAHLKRHARIDHHMHMHDLIMRSCSKCKRVSSESAAVGDALGDRSRAVPPYMTTCAGAQPNHAVPSGTGSRSASFGSLYSAQAQRLSMLRCWRLDELLITGCQDRHCENFWLAKNFLFIHPYPAERSPKMAFSSLDKKY